MEAERTIRAMDKSLKEVNCRYCGMGQLHWKNFVWQGKPHPGRGWLPRDCASGLVHRDGAMHTTLECRGRQRVLDKIRAYRSKAKKKRLKYPKLEMPCDVAGKT